MGLFSKDDNKGSNCVQDQSTGKITCDVMYKKGDRLFSSGTHYEIVDEGNCNFALAPSSRILDEDTQEVDKELRRRKRMCMGGGSIN